MSNIIESISVLIIVFFVIKTLRLMFIIAPARSYFIKTCKSLTELDLIYKVDMNNQSVNLLLWTHKQIINDILYRK